jgi:DNA phosphorothioation-dependent restriction protein DptH
MEPNNSVNTYYQKIIDLVLELYQTEFSNASQGHCMKITGLGINEVEYFWGILKSKFKNISSFIVSDDVKTDVKYITATKLIELRNKQESPLLILIPSNSRTAAEDSYGNATFKEISLGGIEIELKNKLLSEIPDPYSRIIKEDILSYLGFENLLPIDIIKYLIALEENGFNIENIGNFIFYFNLIPDSQLVNEIGKTRSRLKFNLKSTELLGSFNRPIYDRIKDLPLESNTLQKELVQFFKEENQAKSDHEICRTIFKNIQI